jgi:casein kinase 1
MGLGAGFKTVYLIDFGLSKRYTDPITGQHIPYKVSKGMMGTARYASVNTHLGTEQSRRDDMEGMVYILFYFLRGRLPWQGIPAKSKQEKYRRILEVKCATTLDMLCKSLPKKLKSLIEYSRTLKFEQEPNYKFYRDTLRKIAVKNGFEIEGLLGEINEVVETETKEPSVVEEKLKISRSKAVVIEKKAKKSSCAII